MWRRALASEGTDVFYTGEIAEKIVGHLQKNGGIMTMEDMAACVAVAVAVAVTQRLLLSVPQGDTVQLLATRLPASQHSSCNCTHHE